MFLHLVKYLEEGQAENFLAPSITSEKQRKSESKVIEKAL